MKTPTQNAKSDEVTYSRASRVIDAGAFVVLMLGLFIPIIFHELGLVGGFGDKIRLIDTSTLALLVWGAALSGLIAATVTKNRQMAVISALVYGGLVVLRIASFFQAASELEFSTRVYLNWGFGVITWAILVVLFSPNIARWATNKQASERAAIPTSRKWVQQWRVATNKQQWRVATNK